MRERPAAGSVHHMESFDHPASRSHRVLAGFDGSAGSAAAVEWAAHEAAERHGTLRVVMGRALPDAVDFSGVGARQRAELEAVAARVRAACPTIEIDVESTILDPRDALLRAAETADLLVVGSTERGAAKRLLFGSVSRAAARRSPCPLVVVRGDRCARGINRIAVGVDGSSASDAALLWAVEEAELHDAKLVVIHGWDRDRPRAEAFETLEDALELCRQHGSVDVSAELFDGAASTALTAATLEADLVAIGSRGRSGFRTALFGSVALAVAEQSPCPVAITHPRPRPLD